MKKGFFFKIAWVNIKKNYRFFIPRILTEAGLLGAFYIVMTLAADNRIHQMRGGEYVSTFMGLGLIITGILSFILMLYTNSFLMRQRKREFGLYNILGMEKRHICRVLTGESVFACLTALVPGIGFGILFYKLCSLLICRLLSTDVVLGFYFITPKTILPAMLFFILMDLLTLVGNCIRIGRLKPVELLASNHTGEKEPRVKWLLLLLGIATLGGGYYLSLTIKSPLEAIFFFFIAVLLVIVGTYCLFITGTTFVLKLLKRNRTFYYHRRHMPIISGLLYRMKQNAVGLASICVLATAVLVMISTTVSLYAGMEKSLAANYPRHFYLQAYYEKEDATSITVPAQVLKATLQKCADQMGVAIEEIETNRYLEVVCFTENNTLVPRKSREGMMDTSNMVIVTYLTQDEYCRLTNSKPDMAENEIKISYTSVGGRPLFRQGDLLTIADKQYVIQSELYSFPINTTVANQTEWIGIILPGEKDMEAVYREQKEIYGVEACSEPVERLAVSFQDIDKASAVGIQLQNSIKENLRAMEKPEGVIQPMYIGLDALWDARDAAYGMYGSLLFLGLLLGLVFLFATALIIYYKQIAEGYEDRDRYQIMEKIGMSNQEVRKTIREQIVLVFFLPLLTAGVHVIMAYPLLIKLLHLLLLPDDRLFILCTLGVFLAFSLLYFLIFTVTAKSYYKIVH